MLQLRVVKDLITNYLTLAQQAFLLIFRKKVHQYFFFQIDYLILFFCTELQVHNLIKEAHNKIHNFFQMNLTGAIRQQMIALDQIFQDKEVQDMFLPDIEKCLITKTNILYSNVFSKIEQELTIQTEFEKIIQLFERFYQNHLIRKNRKIFLITHWFYYQLCAVKQIIIEEDTIRCLHEKMEKKVKIEDIISQIAAHLKMIQQQIIELQTKLRKSQIFPQIEQFLTASEQMSHEKILEKHHQLIEIDRMMRSACGACGVIEYQLQKHILVEFQKRYGRQSQEGQEAYKSLIPIKQLIELFSKQKRTTEKIKSLYEELKKVAQDKNKYIILEGIKRQITLLDVFLLRRLIDLSQKVSRNEDGKQDYKNIALFVGPSGSGKTTIILDLLGYRLIESEIQGLETLQPENLKEEHAPLRTSPETTSTTRYMFAAKIPTESLPPGTKEDLYACDSPGFQDTAGAEVDISNSISIHNTLRKCKSVKLVVVISQRKVGQKMDGIRQIAKIVSNIVISYKKIEDSVTIILNKFNCQKQFGRLQPGVLSILKNLENAQKCGTEYVSFLQNFRKKLKNNDIVRFNPNQMEIKERIMESLCSENIINSPKEVFKYSLSTKSAQTIENRKNLLLRLVKENLGKNNKYAYYYLEELQLLRSCLKQNYELEKQIENLKEQIRTSVEQKFKAFEQRVENQVLLNDANNNTFLEISKIQDEIRQYEVFKQKVEKLATGKQLQQKITEVKDKMIEDIDGLSYDQNKVESAKTKLVNTIKFFKKFQSQKITTIFQKLLNRYEEKKKQFKKLLNERKFTDLRYLTMILKNILEAIDKTDEQIKKLEANPEQILFKHKQQFDDLKSELSKKLDQIANQAIICLKQDPNFKDNKAIRPQNINLIKETICMLKDLQEGGLFFDEINPKVYTTKVVSAITEYCQRILEQSNRILDISNQNIFNDSNVQKIKTFKSNTLNLKSIQEVYAKIGQKIDRFWIELQKSITNQSQRLNKFLQELKTKKEINRKTLKKFKSMIDKVIKFSQGDDFLISSVNKLKKEIKISLVEHIKYLKMKVDKIKLTLRLKKSIHIEQIRKIAQKFRQVEAFYLVKEFNKKDYFAVNHNDAQLSRLKIADEDEDDQDADDMDTAVIIQEMYKGMIDKLLAPFHEINQESKKFKSRSIKGATLKQLQILQDFLQYKANLEEQDINNKEFSSRKSQLTSLQDNYAANIKDYLNSINRQFNDIYSQSVENALPEKQIYQMEIQRIKQFKRFVNFVISIRSNSYLEQFCMQTNFISMEVLQKSVDILKKSHEMINKELANRKQNQIQYTKKILFLQEKLQELKSFDDLEFDKQSENDFQFTKIYNRVSEEINRMEGRQANSIDNLFKDDNIIISQVKNMFNHLSDDKLKNGQKLVLMNSHLKEYCNKIKKGLQTSKDEFKNQQSLSFQGQQANAYLTKLEKAFKVYQDFKSQKGFQNLQTLPLNKQYFTSQVSELTFQERIKQTYIVVKAKLLAYQYKSRAKEFDKVITTMKKAEYIVSKITNDIEYSSIYLQIMENEKQDKENELTSMNKLSERLKYFQGKINNQFNSFFLEQNSQDSEKKDDFLYQTNFFHLYHKAVESDKHLIEAKIDEIMTAKLNEFQKSFCKTEEEKNKIKEEVDKIIEKLPLMIRNRYKEKSRAIQDKLQQKIKDETNLMKRELKSDSFANIIVLVTRFIESKNPFFQKECRSLLEKELKTLTKDIVLYGSNKKLLLVSSFQKYLKYFGSQNIALLNKVKANERLKQLFTIQEKSICKTFYYQLKQLINQIQSEIIRCSQDGLNSYEKICQQLNQFYIIVLEEEYHGMCDDQIDQLKTIWQGFIQTICNKMIPSFSQCPEIILNFNSSSIQIEKMLVQLKILRIFINCFLRSSKRVKSINNKHGSFVQKIRKVWENYSFDKKFCRKLKGQIDDIVSQLRTKEFYDDLIKVLSTNALEIEFQNGMSIPIRTIRQYEKIYNIFLIQNQEDRLSSSQLISTLRNRWSAHMDETLSQFRLCITHVEEEISPKMPILYNLAQIIIRRKWSFIEQQLNSKEIIENFFQDTFNRMKMHFNQQIHQVEEIYNKRQNIYKTYSEIKSQTEEYINQREMKADRDKKRLQNSIASTVDQDAKQKLQLEFQNIEQVKNGQIQDIKTKNYQNHKMKIQQNEQELRAYIKNNIVKQLIIMKKFIHSVNWKTKDNSYAFTESLQQLNKISKEINDIIYRQLQTSGNNYALIIAAQSSIFKTQAAKEFKNKTSKQDIHYVIKKCPQINRNDDLKEDILKFHTLYSEEYNRIIENFLKRPDEEQIDIIAKQLRDQRQKNDTGSMSDNVQIPVTVARIFAIWSLLKVDLSKKDKISIDFQPHPAQIVAIFLLIGFNDSTLKNSVVEVLTGEGKSIVLAGLCCYLAIKGYYPYCACYSEYLSDRDKKQFKDLFERLQVNQRIKYATFEKHCEEIINEISGKTEAEKSFRQQIKHIITNTANKSTFDYLSRIFNSNLHKQSKKVLIIDEADVFFNQNFFGKLYCPSLSLKDDEIKHLIELIWKLSKESRENSSIQKLSKQEIFQTVQFKKVKEKYPAIGEIIEGQVIGMLQAVYDYQHGYLIHQDAIKYRDNDSITDKISYGYKTVFANCYQYERKAISQLSYHSALKMTLSIAPFSYSELPTFFRAILGVSGTVSSISDYKQQMLKNKYYIEQTYEIPSIYGVSQRTKDSFSIVKDEELYDEIVDHTIKNSELKRPTAIFFKTIKDVVNFYKSPQFKDLTKNTTILSEQTEHQNRDNIIKKVGQSQKITIMTESFSRGTDFKIFDKRIDEIGGLHVIQTFVSSDLSEYIQVRGRTARQGNKGSYQLLINETELQKFQLEKKQNSNFEECLKNAWKKRDQIECQELRKRVESSKQKHEKTKQLFLKKPTKEEIIEFISCQNRYQELKHNHIRTLIGIDGTVSMGIALQKVFNILQESFGRTKAVLENQKVSGSFENEIAIYRNYNTDSEQLLEYSGFQSDSEKLKDFLSKIKINGGWGNEAMQVLFQYANKIKKLDQIILIADARSNEPNETEFKRKKVFGQKYWLENGFPLTSQQKQVFQLKDKKVKIHTLYINIETNSKLKKQQLKQYCQRISNITGGCSSELKVKDENASDFLTGFFVKNILNLIGGQEKGKELMNKYDQNFGNVPLRL